MEGSHYKVQDAREARVCKNPTGMTLTKIPNNEELGPVETTSNR